MAQNDWVKMTPDSAVPSSAVIGAPNCDQGFPTYVGRASHEGGTLPAAVDSKNHCAYVSWGGSQIQKTDYEILVGENYKFVNSSGDCIPLNAVRAGNTADGEPLWVGRGIVEGNPIVGKIHPIHQCMFVGFGGEEHRLYSYEVLVRQPPAPQSNTCVSSKVDNYPEDATVEIEKQPENNISVAEPSQSIPESIPQTLPQSIPQSLPESVPESIPQSLPQSIPQSLPESIPQSVPAAVPECLKSGHEIAHIWKTLDWDEIRKQAVFVGMDNDKYFGMYVGRAEHNGEMLPAKVIPKTKEAYVSYDDKELSKTKFEVLVDDAAYSWVKGSHSGDNIPKRAVPVGQTKDGKQIYVGRGVYQNTLTVGKVYPGVYSVSIPINGKEITISNQYEILVKNLEKPTPHSPKWVSAKLGNIPQNAVVGGFDKNKKPVFVGRAYNLTENLPANVNPASSKVSVSFNPDEKFKDKFEVLVGEGYSWQHGLQSGKDNIPPGAVSTGKTVNGRLVYVGRGLHKDCLIVGKVHPGDNCAYIPFEGKELKSKTYEVLVNRNLCP